MEGEGLARHGISGEGDHDVTYLHDKRLFSALPVGLAGGHRLDHGLDGSTGDDSIDSLGLEFGLVVVVRQHGREQPHSLTQLGVGSVWSLENGEGDSNTTGRDYGGLGPIVDAEFRERQTNGIGYVSLGFVLLPERQDLLETAQGKNCGDAKSLFVKGSHEPQERRLSGWLTGILDHHRTVVVGVFRNRWFRV